MQNILLADKNIYLRNVQKEDALLLALWRNDAELQYLAGVQPVTDPVDLETEINSAVKSEKEAFVVVVRKADEKPIGYIRLNFWLGEKIVWLRMVIGKKEDWNKKYGGEALKLLLCWLFNKLNVHKVECETYAYNARALHFFEKAGFKREGIRRKGHFYDGEYHDVVMFGLLKEEYCG